jgi:hypothetical protein
MESLARIISNVDAFMWGLPLIVLLFGTHLFLDCLKRHHCQRDEDLFMGCTGFAVSARSNGSPYQLIATFRPYSRRLPLEKGNDWPIESCTAKTKAAKKHKPLAFYQATITRITMLE